MERGLICVQFVVQFITRSLTPCDACSKQICEDLSSLSVLFSTTRLKEIFGMAIKYRVVRVTADRMRQDMKATSITLQFVQRVLLL